MRPALPLMRGSGVGFVLVLLACGGDDLVLPPKAPTGKLTVVGEAGQDQHGTVGQRLPQDLVVRVADQAGTPAPGVRVAFLAGAPGADAGQLTPDTAITGTDGHATARWTLGTAAGSYQAEARLVDDTSAGGPSRTTFAAQAVAAAPHQLTEVSGDDQQGFPGTPLAAPLVVQVVDQFGNPVSGVDVGWQVTRGDGSVSASSVLTGPDGRSAVQWTLGFSLARQQATAAANRLVGSPIRFTATIGGP